MPGTTLKMRDVYDDLNDYILEHNYEVLSFGYDPYNADEFVPKWIQDNGPFGVNKVIQGKRTESVPLGELKLMAHNRQILFDQSMMQYTMGNCIAIEDNNGNRMLLKRRHQDKIDSVAAMMDAYISYKLNEEEFVA